MVQRRIIIGDVHGHYNGLMRLLDAIAPTSQDQIYFLGDLIDRGPQSAQVVEFVRQNSYNCLLGNHEHLLCYLFSDNKRFKESLETWELLYPATVNSYKAIGLSKLSEHLEWMQTLPTYLDLGNIWLVHAGVDPTLPLDQQTAKEFCWIRKRFHSISQPYFPDKVIIVGHSITCHFPGVIPGQLVQGQGWLDIDTGAYHSKSGWLTGLDITNRLVYQVNIFNGSTRLRPLKEAVTKISLTESDSYLSNLG